MFHICFSTSQEAAEEWSLSVLFGSYHNLRHSLTYLQACAERDKWLQFLTFAQIHKYPKEQVGIACIIKKLFFKLGKS